MRGSSRDYGKLDEARVGSLFEKHGDVVAAAVAVVVVVVAKC
jgi:hypothetical protein